MKTEEKGRKGKALSRREFLKTSAIGVAGVAAGSLLGARTGIAQKAAQKSIKIGCFGAYSGPAAEAGIGSVNGLILWADKVNREGGLLGRQVEIINRDSEGKPEQGVRYARDYAAQGYDFIYQYGPSSESFAVSAVSTELKKPILSNCNATDYTADPKVRSPYCFRTAQTSLYNAIGFGQYAAKLSKELGLNKWYTIGADYVYGRESVRDWMAELMKKNPQVQIAGQGWPKLFEADYTPYITQIANAKPDAGICITYTGDTISFVKQGVMYGIFEKTKFFFVDLAFAVQPIVKVQGKFVGGLYSRLGYARFAPDTKANHDLNDSYVKRFSINPNEYVWRGYTAGVVMEGAVKKARSTDVEKVIKAMDDLTVPSPIGVGPGGTVTMRGRDHQLINYADGWAASTAEAPYFAHPYLVSWDDMIQEETVWLKNKGWL
jgi:branched-chain amino acid transport system substrate-binding protein